jgi:glutamine synthetase
VIDLFDKTGVLTPVELASRYEVYAEQYVLTVEVEAKLVAEIATTSIYPAAISYLSTLGQTAAGLSAMGVELDNSVAKTVSAETNAMMAAVTQLQTALGEHDFADAHAHMTFLCTTVLVLMETVRSHADALEMIVSDDLWPLAKYREMLFIK